jgi:hypothetical protein
VTLNKGTDSGLRVGMELAVTKPKHLVESVKITKESPDRCEGIVTQMGEDSAVPQVGWRLSTRAPWRALQDQAKKTQ